MEALRIASYIAIVAFCLQQMKLADVSAFWQQNIAPQLGLEAPQEEATPAPQPTSTPAP